MDDQADVIDYLPHYTNKSSSGKSNWQACGKGAHSASPEADKARFEEFLLATVLCHHAQVKAPRRAGGGENDRREKKVRSPYQYEESQIQFAESFGYYFLGRRNRVISILGEGKSKRFEELSTRKVQIRDQWVTVSLIRPAGSSSLCSTLYVKGPVRILNAMMKPGHGHAHMQD